MNIDKLVAAIPAKSAVERADMRANAQRLRESGTPDQKVAAGRMIEALDAQDKIERDALVATLSNMTVGERVVEAFKRVPLTETERKVIQVLLDNPGSLSTELSHALGWEGAWHAHFGRLCHKRQVYLWPAPEKFDATGDDFYSSILADFDGLHITLKPDVVASLSTLGIQAKV